MKPTDFSWQTPDGVKLAARLWSPETAPRAAVLLVHGLGEHCGRYQHVAEAFNAAGVAVLGFDLRGHGLSDGLRGHIPSYDTVADDITHFIAELGQRYPGLPVFLYGHSLGGALVLYAALARQPRIAGVIATSPGLAPGVPVSAGKMAAARILNRVAPKLTMANDLDLNNLSSDPSVKEAYTQDPLVHNRISARLGIQLIEKGQWIMAHAAEFQLPLLLVQGSADHLVDPMTTRRFSERVPANLITFSWREGFFHETHNETRKNETIQTLVDWVIAHIPA